MKKRMTKDERAKRRKANLVMSLLIVFLMTTSILGYTSTRDSTTTFRYNGYLFRQQQDSFGVKKWVTRVDGKTLIFDYSPKQLEAINLSPVIKESILATKLVMLSFDPSKTSALNYMDKARFDITNALYSKGIRVVSGVSNKTKYYNLDIITCANASIPFPVIFLKIGNQTRITLENNCVVMEAQENYEILALKDRLLYSIYGIMK